MSRWILAALAIFAFAIDQVTKSAALAQLVRAVPVPVFPGFNLTLGFNEGASFGMLSGLMAGISCSHRMTRLKKNMHSRIRWVRSLTLMI